ncbi:MAG: hypothetical protein GY874_22780 [Desulfobacteraceae bacterium]|nr:hypothetical protein [Desulfobacteraceae bacterium]
MSGRGWFDPRLRAAWLNCRWIGSPMPNIDPARTMTADKGYVEMGAKILGISRVTVYNRMKRYGISTRKLIDSP